MNYKSNIVLIGFMGTGKTTISKTLAQKLNKNLIETDKVIEKNENKTIREIFEKYGEKYFRTKETNVLISLLKLNNIVLSCGGGIILKDENIKYLKIIGKVFLLVSSPKTILNRVKKENTRPILNNNMNIKYIHNLIEQRKEKYIKSANFIIINENKTILKVVEEIIKKIKATEINFKK